MASDGQSAPNTPSLSENDFQRLQESLLELKTRNYTLEDQCRKQKSALGDAVAKVSVLEGELEKAKTTIQKSKKASEVQVVMQEKDMLRQKLLSQEEDFRLQNQALLTELSNLVSSNEKLEREIEKVSAASNGNSGSGEPSSNHLGKDREEEELVRLRDDLRRAKDETETARAQISQLKRDAQKQEERLLRRQQTQLRGASSPGKVRMADGLVSFSKGSMDEEDEDPEDDIGELMEEELRRVKAERDGAKVELAATNGDLERTREQIRNLETKLDSVQQINRDKEQQINKLNDKISELDPNKLLELDQEKSRLQSQLKAGYDAYNDFKVKKAEEVTELQEKINQLEHQLTLFPPSRREELESELEGTRGELEAARAKVDELEKEVGDVGSKLARAEEEREEIVKISEKRKSILDEMATGMTSKSEEISSLQEHLQRLTTDSQAEIAEIRDRVSYLESRNTELTASETSAKKDAEDLKEKLADIQEELNTQLQSKTRALKESEESHKDMLNVLESEKKMQLRDLNMQLEIANAQRTEFEETCKSLREEVRDLQEDRRIAERKSHQATKDLRRQLQQEKQRNDRLQERMSREEHSFVQVQGDSVGSPASSSNTDREIDPDRHSISSWSMMSGQNDVVPKTASTPIPNSNSPNTSSSSPLGAVVDTLPRDDATTASKLLGKVSSLQEERLVMEEKIHMLENSASAMADELMKKTTLINYYCMEGGKSVAPSLSSGPVQEKMKKMVSLLVHPDQETRREMQRMQNMLEETLTKNMHLQSDLEHLSEEVVRLSKVAATANNV